MSPAIVAVTLVVSAVMAMMFAPVPMSAVVMPPVEGHQNTSSEEKRGECRDDPTFAHGCLLTMCPQSRRRFLNTS